MTEQNPPEKTTPAAKPAQAKKAAPKVGDVLRTGKDSYALVVGTESVRHQHEGRGGESGEVVNRDHPLIVDLPAPRRFELDPYTED